MRRAGTLLLLALVAAGCGKRPGTEKKVRLALESAGQGAFDPALFSQLDRRLTQQLESTLLPGMIQAVRDGKL